MKADYYDGMAGTHLEAQEKFQRDADDDRRERERQQANWDSRIHAANEAYAHGNINASISLHSDNLNEAMHEAISSNLRPYW